MLSPVVTVSIFQKQPDPKPFSAGEVIFEEGQPGDKYVRDSGRNSGYISQWQGCRNH